MIRDISGPLETVLSKPVLKSLIVITVPQYPIIEHIIVLRFRTFEFFRTSVCSPRYHLIYLLMKITLFGSVKPIHLTRDHGAPTDPPTGFGLRLGRVFHAGSEHGSHRPILAVSDFSALLVSVNAFEMIVGSLTLFPSNTFNTKHNSNAFCVPVLPP